MPVIQPPKNLNPSVQRFHSVFKPDWKTLVAMRYVNGARPLAYYQDITGLSGGDGEVQFFGGSVYTVDYDAQPTPSLFGTGSTFYAASTSASDTGYVFYFGIDKDGNHVEGTVVLTGTTPVQIGETEGWVHFNSALLLDGGEAGAAGSITISEKSTAGLPDVNTDNVQLVIQPTKTMAQNPTVMCPKNRVYVFPGVSFTSDKNDGAQVRSYVYKDTGFGTLDKLNVGEWILFQTALAVQFNLPVILEPGECYRWTIERSSSGNGSINATINAGYYELTGSVGQSNLDPSVSTGIFFDDQS